MAPIKRKDKKFSYCIPKEHISDVSNQKNDGWCLAIVVADMVGTILRITREESPHLLLSPQPFIDAQITDAGLFDEFCSCVGLECIRTYPFTRIRKEGWTLDSYKARDHVRHYISGLRLVEDKKEIKAEILKNFGPRGQKFPILGAMHMGNFIHKNVASKIALSDPRRPYQPPSKKKRKRYKPAKEEFDHALLIIGCDTTDKCTRNHYCEVKNSHGEDWGDCGRSFDALNYIIVPDYVPQSQGVGSSIQEGDKHETEFRGVGSSTHEGDTPLDKETDDNLLEKCIFVSDLGLFTTFGEIKTHFEGLEGVGAAVTFVSRSDLTYTRSCIVKMTSKEVVDNFKGEHKIHQEVNICRYLGMGSHSYVEDNGDYRIELTCPNYKDFSEQGFLQMLEGSCHPYSRIELYRNEHYKLTGKVKIRFRSAKHMEDVLGTFAEDICVLQKKSKVKANQLN